MDADKWEPGLHWSFRGEHVLIPSLRLHSFATFLIASIFTIGVCIAERCVTRLLEKRWNPFARCSQWQKVAWRAALYWLAVFMRLNYMLIAMTFHLGLILVIVTTLAIAQFFIDFSWRPRTDLDHIGSQGSLTHIITTRPRSRSKPDAIFIHPTESNLARADAAALELGLSCHTDRVQDNRCDRDEAPWVAGAGQNAARTLLGAAHRQTLETSERDPFFVADDPDSD